MRGLLAALLAAVACGCGLVPASPEQVTQGFWEALRNDDRAGARALASAATADRVEQLLEARQVEEVLIGETLRGETSAIVRTSLATAHDEGVLRTRFDTHLVREGREWRVDVIATERALAAAAFAASIEQLGAAVGQGVQEFGEALEEGAAEINRAIQEALEDLAREGAEPAPQ